MKPSLFILLLFISFGIRAQPYNPVANNTAVVISGNARFTVLSDRLLRMEYAPDGKFNNQATLTFVNRALPVPVFTTSRSKGVLSISTAFITLSYTENSGPFNKKNLHITYTDSTAKNKLATGHG